METKLPSLEEQTFAKFVEIENNLNDFTFKHKMLTMMK